MSIAHVRLLISVGSDPIEGSVITAEDGECPFCGWVELSAAIEAVRAAQTAPADSERLAVDDR